MESLILAPSWFSTVDYAFEVFSLLTTIFVAYYSYRVYRYTDQPKYRTMAGAFLLIALSFGLKVLTELGIRTQVAEMGGIQTLAQVMQVSTALQTGYFAMRLFMLLGLVLLLKLAFNIENRRLLFLLAFFSVMVTVMSHSSYYAFHIAAALMLGFIVEFLYHNFRKKRSRPAGFVLSSFGMLFLAQLCFVFTAQSAKLYPIGETAQLVGFLLLIINHVLVLRR